MLLLPLWGRCDVSVAWSGHQFQSHVVSFEVVGGGWTNWEEAFVPLHCTSLTSKLRVLASVMHCVRTSGQILRSFGLPGSFVRAVFQTFL